MAVSVITSWSTDLASNFIGYYFGPSTSTYPFVHFYISSIVSNNVGSLANVGWFLLADVRYICGRLYHLRYLRLHLCDRVHR
jgi:hypothetical protein